MKPNGLFIGRAVVDVIDVVENFPDQDGKCTALRQVIVAGGPALNAAITFAHFGGQAFLYSSFGQSPFAQFAKQECERYGVTVIDRAETTDWTFPVSCVLTTPRTMSRSVINSPAGEISLPILPLSRLRTRPDIILIDQFEEDAVFEMKADLQAYEIPIVLDGGRWKASSSAFIDLATIPIVSERFLPPVNAALSIEGIMATKGVKRWARTRGAAGVSYCDNGRLGVVEPIRVQAIDTLGAGDIFHGAFCFAYASNPNFVPALEFGNIIAAEACRFDGTRAWMSGTIGR